MFALFVFPLPLLLLCVLQRISAAAAEASAEPGMDVTKRMFSYADLMNNFGGPSPLDFVTGNGYYMLDEERPKREDEAVELLTAWKRSSPFRRGFLNGVLRFGKRMPGVLRFGKRGPQHEKKAVPESGSARSAPLRQKNASGAPLRLMLFLCFSFPLFHRSDRQMRHSLPFQPSFVASLVSPNIFK
uniref:Uncharacterized protein n=1 Tax=Globodera rostochiensis TaxID=31243 RepID=A0A914GTS7_GLORO